MKDLTPDKWRRIKEVLETALDLEPDQRDSFLSKACGDDRSLREQVEVLIAYSDEAGSFIESPAIEVAAAVLHDKTAVLSPGHVIGPYKIIRQLGAGGMGEVYLAEDSKLDREVAIKFLPPESLGDEQAKKRLIREAKAAARLDHPNICTIYEVGQQDDTSFIVMQYAKGETLASRVKGKPPDLAEALEIATQIAAALTEAHAAGVIHRDIKPQNIIINSRGEIKVLDFGLARAIKPVGATDSQASIESLLSAPGAIMGTPGYMSPEQVRGEDLDGRSDIFSFGAVLYEVLTGRPPFAAETAAQAFSEILTREMPPLARYAPDAPPELQRIVSKCLAKDRELRYQSARDLLIDLRNIKQVRDSGGNAAQRARKIPSVFSLAFVALGVLALLGVGFYFRTHKSVTIDKPISSLAVLPLINDTADSNMEYLSDGVTESIINSLSGLTKLRVMARTTVFRYKGRQADPQKVGRELGVDAVVTGRLLQRGDSLSIQADLINVQDGSELWGERYNRKLADVMAVQEEIAKQISNKLQLRLSGEEQTRLTKRYSDNAEAYQAYLKGRFYSAASTESGLAKGIEYFNQAIAVDPNYALAWAGLAKGYWDDSDIHVAPHDVMPKAKQAALKAIAIDDTLAEGHAALAIVLTAYDWDWPNAEKEFKRAIELNRDYPTAHALYGWYLSLMARPEEAIAELKRATELEPQSTEYNYQLGLALYLARRYDDAVAQYRKTLDLDPKDWITRTFLSWALISQGKLSEAIAELKAARQLDDNPYVIGALGLAYALSKNRSEALKTIEHLRERSKQRYVSPQIIAVIYGGLGDNDLAFEWFDKAIEARSEHMGWLNVDPRLDPLRPDPRFADYVRRIGLK